MSAKTFGILACRILALYSVMQVIKYLQVAFFQIATVNNLDTEVFNIVFAVLGAVAPVILLVIFSGALWHFAKFISARMITNIENEEATAYNSQDIEVLLLSLLGMFVIVEALPNISTAFFNYLLIEKAVGNPQGFGMYTKVSLYSALVQVLIGLLLVLRSKGLVGLFRLLRVAGVQRKTEND